VVMGQFLSNSLALVTIYLLYKFTMGSMFSLAWVYGLCFITSSAVLTGALFKSRPDLRPRYKSFERERVKPLLSLGAKFFAVQMGVLIIFTSDRILIVQLLGPVNVTTYEILFKLFMIFTVLHNLTLVPLWPAYSEAFVRRDYQWIKTQLKQQLCFVLFLFVGAILMALAGPLIVKFWIGDQVQIAQGSYFLFAVFVGLLAWSNIFAYFTNAINRLDVQLATATVGAALNIPLSVLFVKVGDLGLNGILLATLVSISLYGVLGPIQVFRILRKGDQ
ncbi:MAG: oligosaccharide flippase family protein, partial [Pseudomonadales bacterium]|nr:oligosaccharide flippase family protein [Pseudomonadales bacterium]